MRAEQTPVFKLLEEGHFETFRPAGATRCTDGAKSTLPRQISPKHGVMMRTFLL